MKTSFLELLDASGWDPKIEFKGAYLFSASKGCTTVSVADRVTLVSELLRLNASAKHRRMKFHYVAMKSDDHRSDYLKILPLLLAKALPKTSRKGGKNLLKLYCDHRSDLKAADIREAAAPMVQERDYTLVEDVVCPVSNRETVGLLYADIVGYLMSRIEVISSDIQMFEDLTPEQIEANGKLRKLRASKNLIRLIKKFDTYKIVPA